jgi:SAM-dependent methyltransferase
VSSSAEVAALRPPPGRESLPAFELGWRRHDGGIDAYLSYGGDSGAVNWSPELEKLHEESSRSHFMDVWTRRGMLERAGSLPAHPTIVDVGCSTGHLLEDLRGAYTDGLLIGVDLVASGLRKAHQSVPQALLLQADACALPVEDASVDLIVSANLLEHVPADRKALAEMFRVLRPGARGVVVVPTGPGTYDYYDRFLEHERRYARGEMVAKAQAAGFEVVEDHYLGSVLYPAFWLVKKRNRRRYGHLRGGALEARVASDIASTSDSRIGHVACELERALLRHGIHVPFGVRGITVLRRPGGGHDRTA